jgi:hypothetical protein
MPRGVWLAPRFYRNPSAPRLSAELSVNHHYFLICTQGKS